MSTPVRGSRAAGDELDVTRVAQGTPWLVLAPTLERARRLRDTVLGAGASEDADPWSVAAGYREPGWRPRMRACPRITPVLLEVDQEAPFAATLGVLRWLAVWEAPVCVVSSGPSLGVAILGSANDRRAGGHLVPTRFRVGEQVRDGWLWYPHLASSPSAKDRARDLHPLAPVAEPERHGGEGSEPALVLIEPTEPVLFSRSVLGPAVDIEPGDAPHPRLGRAERLVLRGGRDASQAIAAEVVRNALRGLVTEVVGDEGWRHGVAPPLLELLGRALEIRGDALHREHTSVRLRRLAYQQHVVRRAVHVSVILATRRPEWLPHAISQVVHQRHRPLDVVIASHGPAADEAARALVEAGAARDVPVTTCTLPGSAVFGDLLNLASERAGGEVLVKMDDDDWYAPEHVDDLLLALDRSRGRLVGKAAEFIHLERLDQTVRRHGSGSERFSTLVAGATLAVRRRDLLDVGGWAPVPAAVDQRLIDAFAGHGELPFRTHGMGFVVHRHGVGQTWAVDDEYFIDAARHQWRGVAYEAAMLGG